MNPARKCAALGWLLIFFGCFRLAAAPATNDLAGQPIYRVLCVGVATNSWQFPLWEKLFSAGYLVEFTGSQHTGSRIGPLKNEVYPGQPVDSITARVTADFRKQPADIVLLDLGQNHSSAEISAQETMTREFRAANPDTIVLVAGSAPVGHWKQDADTKKIADRWFTALKKHLDPPKQSYHPKIVTYKNASGTNLALHIFKPPRKFHGPHPAIVFFFGGGWVRGTPIQFYFECAHFAKAGFVAISADYRVATVEHTTPFESVADGKSAIRWVRSHAKEFDIDPHRIVAAGASAGGHVAAATATIKGLNDPADNLAISPRPDALVLWYGVIDNGPGGYGHDRIKDRYPEISPMHNIDSHVPPTLFFLGTKDSLIPTKTAAAFKAKIEKAGGRCDLMLFEGAPHGMGDYRKGDNEYRRQMLSAADKFLESLGFMAQPAR